MTRLEILQMEDTSPATKVLLLQMNDNARQSVLISCGKLKLESSYDFCKDEIQRNAESREEIVKMESISEAQRSILLRMNENAKSSIELTMKALCQ